MADRGMTHHPLSRIYITETPETDIIPFPSTSNDETRNVAHGLFDSKYDSDVVSANNNYSQLQVALLSIGLEC